MEKLRNSSNPDIDVIGNQIASKLRMSHQVWGTVDSEGACDFYDESKDIKVGSNCVFQVYSAQRNGRTEYWVSVQGSDLENCESAAEIIKDSKKNWANEAHIHTRLIDFWHNELKVEH